MRSLLASLSLLALAASACGWGSGSSYMQQPLVPEDEREPMTRQTRGAAGQPQRRTIGGRAAPGEAASEHGDATGGGGKILGVFRNTYYDFPSEADQPAGGPSVALMNGSCQPIAQVPRGFYEKVCVQGSGSLARGGTVSFAKRDCACAEICPRTDQRICFETLDKASFPWGRGAAGTPITPLRSVAADTQVLPMGTVLYIPDLDGVTDGCFVVEDRGLRVRGEHVDIFTGAPAQTAAINAQVPSNKGVTIVLDAPKCLHLAKR